MSAMWGTPPFADIWNTTVKPAIQQDYAQLLHTPPVRILDIARSRWEKQRTEEQRTKAEQQRNKEHGHDDEKPKKRRKIAAAKDNNEHTEAGDDDRGENGLHAIAKDLTDTALTEMMAEVWKHGEKRGAYGNLSWTNPSPAANSVLNDSITYGKVVNMAIDLFMDTSEVAPASCKGSTSADEDADKLQHMSLPEIVSTMTERPWKIPKAVEKGFEVPILVTEGGTPPAVGEFTRLGLDAVVHAVWLAFYWAKKEDNLEALSALRTLILSWPMDFVLISGSTPDEIDENKFKYHVNMSAKIERLRHFVGLENLNLLRIVAHAAEILKKGNKNTNPDAIHAWLAENIKWGALQCPDVNTVRRHIKNWSSISKDQAVVGYIEGSVQQWGRNNLLDYPTKLQIIVTQTDATNIRFVVQALLVHMCRKNDSDPYASAQLAKVVHGIIWIRMYAKGVMSKYPEVFNDQKTVALVRDFMQNPH